MRGLGAGQIQILRTLEEMKQEAPDGFISPTAVGHRLGNKWGSAWASPKLKSLLRRGLVERNEQGWYRPKADAAPTHPSELQQDHADQFINGVIHERTRVLSKLDNMLKGHNYNPWVYIVRNIRKELEVE